MATDDPAIDDVTFDELESVDQYEATFTGALDGDEVTLTYTLESAVAPEDDEAVYVPGDAELDQVLIQADSYEFETDDRETVRFGGTDDDGDDLFLTYVFAEAEDADENQVGLDVDV
jgi:hypothetical protein